MAVIVDEKLQSFLDGLHAKSREQTALIQAFEARGNDAELPPGANEIKAFRSDKLVALDRNKADFCYQLCRAKKASNVIEVGTSCGRSFLALAAVRDPNRVRREKASRRITDRLRSRKLDELGA